MAAPTLEELIRQAGSRSDPFLVHGNLPRPGGVDPLGLRQINFDLMDRVFPGVNNVARHIRPFVVVAWAWRQAARLAKRDGLVPVPVDLLRDFVARIEVLFALSHFSQRPGADLPGRDVLHPLLGLETLTFGGEDWMDRKETRRLSTALSAPINYGPALRSLGWLVAEDSGAMAPTIRAEPALDALEARLARFLEHDAFNRLGEALVDHADLAAWFPAWDMGELTDAERQVMVELFTGDEANSRRSAGVRLAIHTAELMVERTTASVRGAMAGAPSNQVPPVGLTEAAGAWRRTQVRQLFRLTLEALFAWTLMRLGAIPVSTKRLVSDFLGEAGAAASTRDWLEPSRDASGPVERLAALQEVLSRRDWIELPAEIRRALAYGLSEAPERPESFEQPDRLPLFVAAAQTRGFVDEPPTEFLRHVFEAWLFGQHTFWSVGRGLANARSNGNNLLRLRVVLEEGGWVLAKGAGPTMPMATPDRLDTVLSLATEAGMISPPAP